jgi:hypothetical protein
MRIISNLNKTKFPCELAQIREVFFVSHWHHRASNLVARSSPLTQRPFSSMFWFSSNRLKRLAVLASLRRTRKATLATEIRFYCWSSKHYWGIRPDRDNGAQHLSA